jgi:hypothetical protein
MTTVKLWSGVCATLFIIGLQSDGFGAPRTAQRPAAPAGQLAARTDGSKLTVADREASDFVQSRINESWIKAPDGWTTQFQVRNGYGQVIPDAPQVLFTQYRELTFSIQPETVTATQRLNGADYRAVVEFKNSSVRYYRTVQPKGWSPWEDGTPAFFVVVERRNGKWLISNTDLFVGVKPNIELQGDVFGATQTAQRPVAPAGQRPAAPAELEWLSLCGQCLNPSVTAKIGIGTANAVAEAKVTREDAARWCNNWQPAANAQACIQEQLASETAKKTYRAAASCPAGRILSVDGKTYALAGMWTSDVGKGRSQWRDAAGNIVGQDNASGGLAISQQWEILCPGPIQTTALAAAQQSARAPTSTSAVAAQTRPVPAAAQPVGGQTVLSGPPVCGNQPLCTETLSFAARITDFQALLQNRNSKILTVRLSLQNKLGRPLVLGYVSGTGIATDDRGNRYVPSGERAVQGIGLIQGNAADSKFVLQPGETSDARFEFVWNTSGQEIFGLAFQLELALREINVLPGNQLQLGAERALRFTGLASRDASAGSAATPRTTVAPVPPPATGGAPPVAAAPPVDACAGRPGCYSAGPFVSEVTGITSSVAGSYDLVQVKVRFRNLTNQPIILAYTARSAVMTDNNGGRYTIETAPNMGAGARGIGLVQGDQADSQFALAPGASGDATFTLAKYRPNSRDPVGSVFSLDLTIPQLEVLASRQVRTVREYSVGFSGISGSAAGRAAPAVSSVVPSPAGAAAPDVDACGGKPRCYSAGPFVSEVTGITSSIAGSYHLVQAKVRFRNLTNQPIILAYAAGSAVMTDNNGGRYTIETAPNMGAGARGIGLAQNTEVDPQFVLRPGASRDATFTLARYRPNGRDPVGATFSLDLTVPQLEVLASRQIHTVREYAVSFSDLAPSISVGGLLKGILQGLPK